MNLAQFFRPALIIGTLPVTLLNGTVADATQVMADFNKIVNDVNANAAPLSNTALLNANNNFTAVQSGLAATAAANFPIATQVQDWVFNTLSSTLGTNAITARVAALPLGAYAIGQVFTFIPSQRNTGSATLNINSLGSSVIKLSGRQLLGGELGSGAVAVRVASAGAMPVLDLLTPKRLLKPLTSGEMALVGDNGLITSSATFTYTDASNVEFEIINTQAAGNAALNVQTNGTGDAKTSYLVSAGAGSWSHGIDNSVTGDPYVISAAADLGTSNAVVIETAGTINVCASIATPAGGSGDGRLIFGTSSGLGIYFGSGVPTVSANKGSLYIRTDGSSTSTRSYIATDGAGTWTAITTAA